MENKINTSQIAGAILIVGVIIAGAILLRGKTPSVQPTTDKNQAANIQTAPIIAPVSAQDHTLGNLNAKVTIVEYADFQCPFCGKFYKETEQPIISQYVNTGKVQLVYRDFAFLGEESIDAAEASWCAGDQGKYWEYNNYLFTHQNGENKGAFSVPNLESFAKGLGLNTTTFNQCLESKKYEKAVNDSTTEAGQKAGVQGTPKGYILVNGNIVETIDGAQPLTIVAPKIEAALK